MKKIYSCRRYPPKEDIRDECDQCKVSSVNADMPRGNLSFDQLIQIARNITGTGKFWLVFVIVAGIWLLGGLAFVNHFTGLGIQDEINRRFDANNIQGIIAILNHLRATVYCINLGNWQYFFCRIPFTKRSLICSKQVVHNAWVRTKVLPFNQMSSTGFSCGA